MSEKTPREQWLALPEIVREHALETIRSRAASFALGAANVRNAAEKCCLTDAGGILIRQALTEEGVAIGLSVAANLLEAQA